MKLVIAEKPSVAMEIAKVIGASKRCDGYMEGNGYIVSWCVGHLVANADPEQYNQEWSEWKLETLPMLPSDDEWQTKVLPDTKDQYNKLTELMERSDVTELVCATDAGQEGELIFRLVYNYSGCRKPFMRLWISSMESTAIEAGFKNLEPGSNYDNLYNAALARSRGDWKVGLNGTRAYTCLYRRKGIRVGRVQTPTINMIVTRQQEIDNFVPKTYYVISAGDGEFTATRRADSLPEAEDIINKCSGRPGVIKSLEKKEQKKNPPALYDLTTLQRDANRLCGYTSQETLDALQSLYEKKLTTYPRTDSCYLTEDMHESTEKLVKGLVSGSIISSDSDLQSTYRIQDINIDRCINNSKVTDHHAVIPTSLVLKDDISGLTAKEKNVLLLVVYRLLTAVYLPERASTTKAVLDVENTEFTASGRQVMEPGFKAIEDELKKIIKAKEEKSGKDKDEVKIPAYIAEGYKISSAKLGKEERKTKPPSPYTEDTLLAAMETAGKHIEDEELREQMKNLGLGTPATRSGIIEKIISNGYVERKGKQLLPTLKAVELMDLLQEDIKSPELTAKWEEKLVKMRAGDLSLDEWTSELDRYVKEFIEAAKAGFNPDEERFKQQSISLGRCPRCGADVTENPSGFVCSSGKDKCGFAIWKNNNFFKSAKKTLTAAMVEKMLAGSGKGKVLVKGLTSSKGTKYDAFISLDDTGTYVNFKIDFPDKKTGAKKPARKGSK